MNKFLAALFAGVLALLLLSGAARALTPAPFDPVLYERQQIAIERARALAPVETLVQSALMVGHQKG